MKCPGLRIVGLNQALVYFCLKKGLEKNVILFQTLVKHVNIQKLCVSLFELKTSIHVRSHDHFISSSYCYPKCFTCATCNKLILTLLLFLLFKPMYLVIKEITNQVVFFFCLQKQNSLPQTFFALNEYI